MNTEKMVKERQSSSDKRNEVVRRNQLARRMAQGMSLSSHDVDPNNLTTAEKKLLRKFLEADGPIEVVMGDDPTMEEPLSMEEESLPRSPKTIETVTIPSYLLIQKKLVQEAYGEHSMGTWKNINPPSPSTSEQSKSVEQDTDCSEDRSFDGESFAEDMEGLAKDMEDQALRERRETFQAEILDIGWGDIEPSRGGDRRVEIVLDIPTVEEPKHKFLSTPKCDRDRRESLTDITEVLNYLNASLHHADQITGMSIPVSYEKDRAVNWKIALGENEGRVERIEEVRFYFLKRVTKPLRETMGSMWSWFTSWFSWARFAAISIITISVSLILGVMGLYTPGKLITLALVAFGLEMAAVLFVLEWME